MKLFKYPFMTKCFLNFTELEGRLLKLPKCEGSRELEARPHPAVLGSAQCPRLRRLGLSSAEQIFVSTLHKNTLELIVFTLQMLCK